MKWWPPPRAGLLVERPDRALSSTVEANSKEATVRFSGGHIRDAGADRAVRTPTRERGLASLRLAQPRGGGDCYGYMTRRYRAAPR